MEAWICGYIITLDKKKVTTKPTTGPGKQVLSQVSLQKPLDSQKISIGLALTWNKTRYDISAFKFSFAWNHLLYFIAQKTSHNL